MGLHVKRRIVFVPMSTAAVIIIGNEILSGRTQDKNLSWLATQLNELGIQLREARTVRDEEAAIAEAVNACRTHYSYVFTTGGIGPTHDDITSRCIAAAFGVPLIRHPEAVKAMESYYGEGDLTEARLKMAEVPEGATLVHNPVSSAPGYHMENVYVLAGIPAIMQAMFDGVRPQLKGSVKMLSRALRLWVSEGAVAEALSQVQDAHPQVEIGSYPLVRENRLGTTLVARATDTHALDTAFTALQTMADASGGEWEEEASEIVDWSP